MIPVRALLSPAYLSKKPLCTPCGRPMTMGKPVRCKAMNASEWPRFVGASGFLLLHWLHPAAEPLPIFWAWTSLQVFTYSPDPRRFQSIEGDRVAVVYYLVPVYI